MGAVWKLIELIWNKMWSLYRNEHPDQEDVQQNNLVLISASAIFAKNSIRQIWSEECYNNIFVDKWQSNVN